MDNVPLKIYDPEKTIVDCFKFRNKIGMDVVLEALKCYRQRMNYDPVKLLDYGKICRIKKFSLTWRPFNESNKGYRGVYQAATLRCTSWTIKKFVWFHSKYGYYIYQNNDHQNAVMHWVKSYRIAKEIGEAQVLSALENLAQQLGGKNLSF